MTDQPTSGPALEPTLAYGSRQPEWLTYREAAERLGIDANAVAARARRGGWPKRRRNERPNPAEILVPAELLEAGPRAPQERDEAPQAAPDVAGAVRAAIAPLADALAREAGERKALQVEADGLRERLAASEVATARATGETNVERAKREAAETRAKYLQSRLDKVLDQFEQRQLEASKPPPKRRWWQF